MKKLEKLKLKSDANFLSESEMKQIRGGSIICTITDKDGYIIVVGYCSIGDIPQCNASCGDAYYGYGFGCDCNYPNM